MLAVFIIVCEFFVATSGSIFSSLPFPYAPSFLFPSFLPASSLGVQVWSPAQWLGPCTPGLPALRLCLETLCQPVGDTWVPLRDLGCATCYLSPPLSTLLANWQNILLFLPLTATHPSPWNRFGFQAGSTNPENVPNQTDYCPLALSCPSERKRKSFSNKRLRPLPSPKYPWKECKLGITHALHFLNCTNGTVFYFCR